MGLDARTTRVQPRTTVPAEQSAGMRDNAPTPNNDVTQCDCACAVPWGAYCPVCRHRLKPAPGPWLGWRSGKTDATLSEKSRMSVSNGWYSRGKRPPRAVS